MTDTPTSEQERREAKVVSRHLPSGYSAEPNVLSDDHGNAAASASDLMQPGQESSLKLLGGDIYRDLYKINTRAKLHQRAATFSHLSPRTSGVATPGSDGEMAAAEQRAPGGFCRQYPWRQQGCFNRVMTPVTRNFVSFLELYGRNQRMRLRLSRMKMRSHGPWMKPGHKGMPKGWLYSWEGMATMGKQNPETRLRRKLACSLSVCDLAVSNRYLKDSSCAHKGPPQQALVHLAT
jgi:hypothetical protein